MTYSIFGCIIKNSYIYGLRDVYMVIVICLYIEDMSDSTTTSLFYNIKVKSYFE